MRTTCSRSKICLFFSSKSVFAILHQISSKTNFWLRRKYSSNFSFKYASKWENNKHTFVLETERPNIIRIMSTIVIASPGFTNQKNFLRIFKAATGNSCYVFNNNERHSGKFNFFQNSMFVRDTARNFKVKFLKVKMWGCVTIFILVAVYMTQKESLWSKQRWILQYGISLSFIFPNLTFSTIIIWNDKSP